MLDYLHGTPKRLDVGFVPSPSGGQMHLWQNEEGHRCYVLVDGYAPKLDAPDRVETVALITGVGCVQSVFGYPNEEAFWKDPRGDIGHGCFEIEGSEWEANLQDYNRRTLGSDYHFPGPLHHYFVGSKDGSCQMLAQHLEVEVFPDKKRWQVIELVNRREAKQFADTLRQIQEMQARNVDQT